MSKAAPPKTTAPKTEAAKTSEPETTQAAATAAPPRDASGFELDSWGLPVSGPMRAVRLAEMQMPDPLDDPKEWKKQSATTNLTETENQDG
jgi:hypothetical protein